MDGQSPEVPHLLAVVVEQVPRATQFTLKNSPGLDSLSELTSMTMSATPSLSQSVRTQFSVAGQSPVSSQTVVVVELQYPGPESSSAVPLLSESTKGAQSLGDGVVSQMLTLIRPVPSK